MTKDDLHEQDAGFGGDSGREKQHRGFAAMDERKQRKFASRGGSTTVKRKGKEYMRELGRKGGKNSRRMERDLREQAAQARELPFDVRTVVNVLEGAQRELPRNPDAANVLLSAALRLLNPAR